jgi:hypothetical protein
MPSVTLLIVMLRIVFQIELTNIENYWIIDYLDYLSQYVEASLMLKSKAGAKRSTLRYNSKILDHHLKRSVDKPSRLV